MIEYKNFEDRTPDNQYKELLKKIKTEGISKVPIHARLDENKNSGHANAIEITGAMLSYDMTNGFPVLTERDLKKSFRGAIGELVGFLNGAKTLTELESYGMPRIWWENWVTKEKCEFWGLEEGNLGDGSYGATLAGRVEQGLAFNQVKAVMNQMRKLPFLRTHILTTWNPALSMGDESQGFKRQVVVAPCHGNFVHFVLFDHTKELQMTHTQRSADVPVGLQFNIIEWSALGLMVAHLLGYKFTKYTHFLSNPHFYDIQTESVDELLSRETRRFPTVRIKEDCTAKELTDFRPDDFILEDDYQPHPYFKIPTPI